MKYRGEVLKQAVKESGVNDFSCESTKDHYLIMISVANNQQDSELLELFKEKAILLGATENEIKERVKKRLF